eukprot:jgi/Botrbrau1/9765/Bobra.85_1s0015.1
MVEQLYSTAWTSPRKTMAPGSRVPMEVRSLDGNFYHIVLDGHMNLEEVRARIAQDTGIPQQRQLMVVSEERARRANIGGLAKRLQLALNAQRDLRSLVMSLVKFIVLPEFVYRELNGRGAISWRVQVEMLGGQVVLLEADVNATLSQFREAIEEEVGICTGQQRLICVECAESGIVTAVANSMLLRGLGFAKLAASLTRTASSKMLGLPRAPNAYTIRIDLNDGTMREMDVTGEMTIDQVRRMVQKPEDTGSNSGDESPRVLCKTVAQIVFPESPIPKPSPQIIRLAQIVSVSGQTRMGQCHFVLILKMLTGIVFWDFAPYVLDCLGYYMKAHPAVPPSNLEQELLPDHAHLLCFVAIFFQELGCGQTRLGEVSL